MVLTEKDIDFVSILKVPGVLFAYFLFFFGMINFTVYTAILPLKLNEFGYINEDMGYIYLVQNVPYILLCLLHSCLFS